MQFARILFRGVPALCAAVLLCASSAWAQAAAPAPGLQLAQAVIVTPENPSRPEQKAVAMLLDEIEKRSFVRLTVQHSWPTTASAVIAVGRVSNLPGCLGALGAEVGKVAPQGREGYVVRVLTGAPLPTALVTANEARGLLFGVGRLLRELRMTPDSVLLDAAVSINTAPQTAMRGHQAGYRPKVNTYDGWTVPMWEQYYRDLIVFGTNAIELMPPRTDDDADSPHFTLSQIDMIARLSQMADDYDLDFWVWYPAMAKDYGDPATVEQELKEWGEVFKRLPRLDAIFVPGGDPGHTQPKYMMGLLEKATQLLHATHPKAQMWMSPQGFTQEWMNEFVEIMNTQKPAWLSGVVFGPQLRLSLPDLRKALPAQYPIRHYPDITHSYCSQFPVHDWDLAYKLTQDREVINPRPVAFTEIYRWAKPYTCGFISYSEGCNDDLNKMLWSMLGWDDATEPFTLARDYARYFMGPEYEYEAATLLMSLEKNWQGSLLTNASVMSTLRQAQDLDRIASPQLRLSWRFQQLLYRAYYDAYVYRRLHFETGLEQQAMAALDRAGDIGALLAVEQAQRILDKAKLEPVALDLRGRVSDMAEALYQSVRMQLSVPRYQAIDAGRGANFDLIDTPLNNSRWLKPQFDAIRAMGDEKARLAAIREITNWTNPGPGGYYDDLGNPAQQPHLVRQMTTDFDPENRSNPLLGYENEPFERRTSWFDDAETRFEAPLKMQYDNLDPKAQYKVRAVYAGDKFDTEMKLTADDGIEVHPLLKKEFPIRPVEFDIPQAATADGRLTLSWTQTPGRGSAGRGTQVAEVWLIKK